MNFLVACLMALKSNSLLSELINPRFNGPCEEGVYSSGAWLTGTGRAGGAALLFADSSSARWYDSKAVVISLSILKKLNAFFISGLEADYK